MSNPTVLHELQRIEIDWSDECGNQGLLIEQADSLGNDSDAIWIPASHVPAFIAAIQSVYAKR